MPTSVSKLPWVHLALPMLLIVSTFYELKKRVRARNLARAAIVSPMESQNIPTESHQRHADKRESCITYQNEPIAYIRAAMGSFAIC